MYKKKSRKRFVNSVYKSLFIANFLQLLLETVAAYVDSVIGGNLIGDAAIAAIGVVTPLYELCFFLGAIISVGASNVYSRYIGAMENIKAYKSIGQGLIISLILGLVSSVFMYAIMDVYILSQGLSTEVTALVYDYYYCFIFLCFMYPLYYFISLLVYVDGGANLVTWAELSRFVCNIVLSLIFICVFDMGLFGLSLGTTVAMVVTVLVISLHFFKKSVKTRFMLGFKWKDLADSISIGAPNTLTYLASAVLVFSINQYIIAHYGDLNLVIYSAVSLVSSLVFVFLCIANACMPLFSVYYGEKNKAGQKRVLCLANKYSLIFGVILSVVVFAGAEFIPIFLGVESSELYDKCTFAVRITSLSSWICVFINYVVQIHPVSGYTKLGIAESVFITFVGPLSCCILAISLFGIEFIGLGYLFEVVIAIVVFGGYILIRHGAKSLPFILKDYNNKSIILDLNTDQNISEFNEKVGIILKEECIKTDAILKTQLIIEEMFVFSKNYNKKTVLIEISFIITGDNLQLIYRDTGSIIDITDDTRDYSITKEIYMLDSIAQTVSNFAYLTTVSYNKNTYEIAFK